MQYSKFPMDFTLLTMINMALATPAVVSEGLNSTVSGELKQRWDYYKPGLCIPVPGQYCKYFNNKPRISKLR